MTAVDVPPPPNELASNGHGAPVAPAGLPAAPRRPRNVIWMVTGLALMLVAALAALSAASALSDRTDVLVASRDLSRGDVIDETDFVVAPVASDVTIEVLLPADLPDIVGMVATGTISRGTVVNAGHFTPGGTADQVTVVVGFDLPPGSYPRGGLLPGDTVGLIEVFDPAFDSTLVGEPRRLGEGEIVETVGLAQPDHVLVSVRVPERLAAPLSQVAHENRLRLIQTEAGAETTVTPLEPVEPASAADTAETGDGGSASDGDGQ